MIHMKFDTLHIMGGGGGWGNVRLCDLEIEHMPHADPLVYQVLRHLTCSTDLRLAKNYKGAGAQQ